MALQRDRLGLGAGGGFLRAFGGGRVLQNTHIQVNQSKLKWLYVVNANMHILHSVHAYGMLIHTAVSIFVCDSEKEPHKSHTHLTYFLLTLLPVVAS